jgi:hypothetical protein
MPSPPIIYQCILEESEHKFIFSAAIIYKWILFRRICPAGKAAVRRPVKPSAVRRRTFSFMTFFRGKKLLNKLDASSSAKGDRMRWWKKIAQSVAQLIFLLKLKHNFDRGKSSTKFRLLLQFKEKLDKVNIGPV